jgi:hypothetical protein
MIHSQQNNMLSYNEFTNEFFLGGGCLLFGVVLGLGFGSIIVDNLKAGSLKDTTGGFVVNGTDSGTTEV